MTSSLKWLDCDGLDRIGRHRRFAARAGAARQRPPDAGDHTLGGELDDLPGSMTIMTPNSPACCVQQKRMTDPAGAATG